MTSRHCFWILFSCGLLFLLPGQGNASIDCYQCHGESSPVDYRPLDASHRNISTGGFQGNHRTHITVTTTAAACAKCHPDSGNYSSSHRNGLIKVSSHINNSTPVTPYNNRTSAFLQTATPILGGCANVNCHFETTTPPWGNDPAVTGCTTCHGAPPAGTSSPYSGGAAGSHALHTAYYPEIGNCMKCHPDHSTESAPFAHATSIGNRDIVIRLRDPLNNIYGSFSAGTRGYLPSQVATHTYGTCKNTYCHSTVQADGGTGEPAYGAPTWGANLNTCNTTCHGVGGTTHNNAPTIATGSHTRHLAYYFGQGTANPIFNCTTCHHWPPVPSVAACAGCHVPHGGGGSIFYPEVFTKHVNGVIDVAFNPNFTNGTYNGSSVPRSGYGDCSNTFCHSDGTSVATGTVPANASPVWGAGAMPCNGCHGSPPAYGNGSPKANSHAKHAAAGFGCNACHSATTADGTTIASTVLHVNRSYNLAPGAGISFSYAFAPTGGTCSTISCHNNGNAVWGATLTCGDCHSTPPGGD